MATGADIVKKMLQRAGVLTKNEEPSADELNDGLDALNNMVASWSNNSLLVYARTWEDFNLSSGVSQYTIGSGGDFDTARPNQILEAHIKSGNVKYENLSIVGDVVYNRYIDDLNITGYPLWLNFDNSNPLGIIRLYPKPSSALTLFMLTEKPVTAFTAAGVVSLPPGWERALIFNGAIEVSGEYGVEPPASTIKIARESKGNIQRAIAKVTTMDSQPMGGENGFNIYRGW